MMSSYTPMALMKSMFNMFAKSSNAFSTMVYMPNSRSVNSMFKKLDFLASLYLQMASQWNRIAFPLLLIGWHLNPSMMSKFSSALQTFIGAL